MYVAVIVAFPFFIPFTVPDESTVAILVSLDLYFGVTVLSLYVAVIVSVLPSFISMLVLFKVKLYSGFAVDDPPFNLPSNPRTFSM